MKSFLLFLCLAAAEKLDRTYLPPPGSKFSGGVPGDIQAPFEIPKETFSTRRPDIHKNEELSPEDTQIEIGINRGVPLRPGSSGDIITSGGQRPSDYYQNTYKVPTTTTSYAFTTTTTHTPKEAYETTIGQINPVTGLPTTAFDFPTTAPSFVTPENYYQGNQQVPFQQNQQQNRNPVYGPSQYSTTSTLTPSSQFIEQNRPGFVQGNNLLQTQKPVLTPGSTQRPSITTTGEDFSLPNIGQGNNYFNSIQNQRPSVRPGSPQRPGYSQNEDSSQYQGGIYPVNSPGIGQQNILVPSTFAPGTSPSTIQYGGDLDQGIISNQNIPFSNENVPAMPINTKPIPDYSGQTRSEYVIPDQLQQSPNTLPGQAQYGSIQGLSNLPQYSASQTDEYGRPVAQNNNVYKPISTASPTLPDQFFSTPGSLPSATTIYPTGSYPTTSFNPAIGNQVIQTGPISRPERPQAESDRNAVILNYENVITPEGFAYSFDTSNGIHADESGTAVDGVKTKGSYSYIGDDGKLYSVVYTADENGFQPHGDHLPTSPPIPEAIKKVLEQAKKDQKDGISDDGTYDEYKYGHMKYQGKKQQRPNRINIDDEVPERNDNQYTQSNRQKQNRPQVGNKVQVSNQNDYNEDFDDEQIQDGKIPVNNEEYDNQFKNEVRDKITSHRPTVRPAGDRKQLGGKFSMQSPDQYFEEDKNGLRPDQGSTLEENYPVAINTEEKYYIDADKKKPTNNKSLQRLEDNTQDYKDDLFDYDVNKSTDIPSSLNDGEEKEYKYKRPYGDISTRRPDQPTNNARIPSTADNVQQRYGSRIRPVTSTTRPFDQSNVYNYQNSRRPGSISEYLPGKSYTDHPAFSSTTNAPISSQYTGSPVVVMQQDLTRLENLPGQSYRPNSNNVPNIPGVEYNLPEANKFDSNRYQVPVSGKVDGTVSSNQRRLQPSITLAPQQDNKYYNSRISKPDVSKVQNKNHSAPGLNRYTTVAPTKKDEGYQYLPPQRKFEHGSQFPQSFESTSNRPSQDRTYFTKEEVAKPFITPDASRDENTAQDDYGHTEGNQENAPQHGLVQANIPSTTSQQTYEKYDKENGPVKYGVTSQDGPKLNPDRRFGSGKDKFSTIDLSHRPPYQTTTRPQFGPASVYDTTKGSPTSTVRPHVYYDRDGNEVTYVPSSPKPSQTTQFETTEPATLKPVNQNNNRLIAVNNQIPAGQGFIPTTTRPTQRPGSFNGRPTQIDYDRTPSQSPYQITYKPTTTVTSGVDSDETLDATIRPDNAPFKRPGYSQSQVSSTTYRPAFIPSNVGTEKQITVDNYGRPVPNIQSGNQQEYRPGFSASTQNYVPSGQDLQRPEGDVIPNVDMNGRPTTEKIIGEDFSGPKQAQKFDPERGYYY